VASYTHEEGKVDGCPWVLMRGKTYIRARQVPRCLEKTQDVTQIIRALCSPSIQRHTQQSFDNSPPTGPKMGNEGDTYVIKGIKAGVTDTTVPRRLEADSWYPGKTLEHLIQNSLFIWALKIFQERDPSGKLSFFQIAGIHGYPYQPWDEEDYTAATGGMKKTTRQPRAGWDIAPTIASCSRAGTVHTCFSTRYVSPLHYVLVSFANKVREYSKSYMIS
jgi:hypothetical protein